MKNGQAGIKKILVVDDQQDNLDFFSVMLSKFGFEVSTAIDGFSALESAKETLPDIIIIDLAMPRMNGYQVAEEVRKDFKLHGSKLVAVTGFSAFTDKKRAVASGFDYFITKPADPKEFGKLIDQLTATQN